MTNHLKPGHPQPLGTGFFVGAVGSSDGAKNKGQSQPRRRLRWRRKNSQKLPKVMSRVMRRHHCKCLLSYTAMKIMAHEGSSINYMAKHWLSTS